MPGLTLDCDGVTTRSSCDHPHFCDQHMWHDRGRCCALSTLCTGHKKVYVATLPLPPNSHVWRGHSVSLDNRYGELRLQLDDERSFLDATAPLKQPLFLQIVHIFAGLLIAVMCRR